MPAGPPVRLSVDPAHTALLDAAVGAGNGFTVTVDVVLFGAVCKHVLLSVTFINV